MARSSNRKNRELRAPATDRQPDVKLGVSDRSQGRFLLRGLATPDPGEMEAKTRTAPFPERRRWYRKNRWLRGQDLNLRHFLYEANLGPIAEPELSQAAREPMGSQVAIPLQHFG